MKRTLCIVLSLILVFLTAITVSANSLWPTDPDEPVSSITCDQAIRAYQAEAGRAIKTRRYYFQMPDGVHGFCDENGDPAASWYDDHSQGAGVYWWNGPAKCDSWPGYRAMVADEEQHIYYVNMPVEVINMIWNNGVDYITDPDVTDVGKLCQTVDINCENANPDEYDSMPEGCSDFDECIYVIAPEVPTTAVLNPLSKGTWYFYYGNGCYGKYSKDSDNFKSVSENCCNPDHLDVEGNHITAYDPAPTEPPTEKPTQKPTEKPTEPENHTLTPDSKTVDEAIVDYEAEHQTKLDTFRCYFQMPDGVHGFRDENGDPGESWYNEYAFGAGVYWWKGPASCATWPGYRANVADKGQNIYCADIPKEVEVLIWNNGVDGGIDTSLLVYQKAGMTVDISCEPAEPGEYDTMPEGCDSYDECIYINKPVVRTTAPFTWINPEYGSWYFYYGDGCYGMYSKDSDNFKSVAENCCNPDHFDADGNHIGYIPENAIRGDYDTDGEITVMDATRAQNIIAELKARPSEEFLKLIDADGDGELTILDATRIQNVLAELMTMDGQKPE